MKLLKALRSNVAKLGAVLVAGLASVSAQAALPTAATTAMTDISTGITDAVDAAWPLIGAALTAGIVIKLVKRFTNKA